MSNLIWTPPKYLAWSVFKSPEMSTLVQKAVSGKTTRAQLYADPIWNYRLTWELLKDSGAAPTNLKSIVDFFLSRGGSFDTFLYADPDDNIVTGQLIGVGDGATTSFQLLKSFVAGGFVESVQNPNVVSALYLNGTPQAAFSYAIGTENQLLQSQHFTSAPWFPSNNGASNPTVTDNVIVAPDGTTTAATVAYPSTVGGSVYSEIDQQLLAVQPQLKPGDQVTFSVWLKVASGAPTAQLFVGPVNGSNYGNFNPVLTSSWVRYQVTGTVGSLVPPANAGPLNVRIRSNNQAAVTFHVWGAQFERWPAATGYLATTTAPVSPQGIVTLASAPAAGTLVTADFSFYYRLRFKNDLNEFEQFMSKLWRLQTLELVSEKL